MSVRSSGSSLSTVPLKSRAYRFSIPLNPFLIEGGVDSISEWAPDPAPSLLNCNYACGSVTEIGEPATYTFQGYAEFKGQVTTGQIGAWLGPAAQCVAVLVKDRQKFIDQALKPRGKMQQEDLLSKGWEVGSDERKSSQGERRDAFEIRDILAKHGPIEGPKLVARNFPGQFMRYASGIERLADILQPASTDKEFVPRVWQEALITLLKRPAHDRWIFWVYDDKGGAGKSRLTKYLCCEMNAIEVAGRAQDIAYAYQSQPIVLFDIARATKFEACNDLWEAAEKLKDGRIFSSKYMSKTKAFRSPHVVFFSNMRAPPGIWSADRLQEVVVSTSGPSFSATSVPIGGAGEEHEETGLEQFEKISAEIRARRDKEREEKRIREDEVAV